MVMLLLSLNSSSILNGALCPSSHITGSIDRTKRAKINEWHRNKSEQHGDEQIILSNKNQCRRLQNFGPLSFSDFVAPPGVHHNKNGVLEVPSWLLPCFWFSCSHVSCLVFALLLKNVEECFHENTVVYSNKSTFQAASRGNEVKWSSLQHQ